MLSAPRLTGCGASGECSIDRSTGNRRFQVSCSLEHLGCPAQTEMVRKTASALRLSVVAA